MVLIVLLAAMQATAPGFTSTDISDAQASTLAGAWVANGAEPELFIRLETRPHNGLKQIVDLQLNIAGGWFSSSASSLFWDGKRLHLSYKRPAAEAAFVSIKSLDVNLAFNEQQKIWTGLWVQDGHAEKVSLRRPGNSTPSGRTELLGDWMPVGRTGCLHIVNASGSTWAPGEFLGAWIDDDGEFGRPITISKSGRRIVFTLEGMSGGNTTTELTLSPDGNSLKPLLGPGIAVSYLRVPDGGCYSHQ